MLISVSRKAMHDEFEVSYPRREYPHGTAAALDALDEVERVEQMLSVFRFDSRVHFINLTAHEAPVRLDDELFGFITFCKDVSDKTEGAVDITTGQLWKCWGFAKRQGQIPAADEWEFAKQHSGFHLVELDAENNTVFFKRRGVELNFGCVGKGFALDVAAKKLDDAAVGRYLFQGGLSSFLARSADTHRWLLGIAHPLIAGQRLQTLELTNMAVSTSGSQKQFFRAGGKRYSHILAPRSGAPAEGVLSVTVLAPTAAYAELLSTAFFVLGPEGMRRYAEIHPDISALMCIPSKKAPGFEVIKTANGIL